MKERRTPNVHSATTIIDCGPALLLAQEQKDMWAKSGQLVMGGALHASLKLYLVHLWRHDLRIDEEAAGRCLEEGLGEFPAHPSREPRIRQTFWRFVRGFYMPPAEAVEGIELGIAVHWSGRLAPFDVDLLDHDRGDKKRAAAMGWLLRAALDFVHYDEDGVLCVRDWKSQHHVPTETWLKNARQPQIYMGLASLTFGLAPDDLVAFIWHCLPYGLEVRIEMTARKAEDHLYAWLDTYRRIDRLPPDDEFWTRPRRNPGCTICPLRQLGLERKPGGCSEWSGETMEDLGSDRILADIEYLVGSLGWSRAELKERLQALPAGSTIVDGGHQARLQLAYTTTSDGGAFIRWCRERGIEPLDAWLRVDLDKAKRKKETTGLVGILGRPWEEIEAELLEVGVLKRKPKLTLVIEPAPGIDPVGDIEKKKETT